MKIRLYEVKFVYNFKLTELDTVKCSHGWNNEMQYVFLFLSWHIRYSPSHKQASCLTVLEILFGKSNSFFRTPQKVRLSWYTTSLTVEVEIQYKLGVLMKKNPELFPFLRCTRLFCCNSSLPQFNWCACWLHCTDCWVLERMGFKINHSKTFCFKLWNSGRWAVQESKHEQLLWRLAMSPPKACLEPQPRGKNREHPKFLHPCTQCK